MLCVTVVIVCADVCSARTSRRYQFAAPTIPNCEGMALPICRTYYSKLRKYGATWHLQHLLLLAANTIIFCCCDGARLKSLYKMAASVKDKRTPITTPPYQVPSVDVTPDPPTVFSCWSLPFFKDTFLMSRARIEPDSHSGYNQISAGHKIFISEFLNLGISTLY